MSATIKTDVLVIGEGSGGQVAALAASEAGVNVTLLFNGLASATHWQLPPIPALHDVPPPPPPLAATAKQFSVTPGSVMRKVRITAPIDLEAGQQYDVVTEPTGGYASYPLPLAAKSKGARLKLYIPVSPEAAQGVRLRPKLRREDLEGVR